MSGNYIVSQYKTKSQHLELLEDKPRFAEPSPVPRGLWTKEEINVKFTVLKIVTKN